MEAECSGIQLGSAPPMRYFCPVNHLDGARGVEGSYRKFTNQHASDRSRTRTQSWNKKINAHFGLRCRLGSQ
jgi:hypothetical protein